MLIRISSSENYVNSIAGNPCNREGFISLVHKETVGFGFSFATGYFFPWIASWNRCLLLCLQAPM
ncbi:AAEL015440-PA, partial [Aedes aegypti]